MSRRHVQGLAWAAVVLVASLGLTVAACRVTRAAIATENKSTLEFQINEIASTLDERVDDYEQTLLGAAGLFAASPSVSREQWRRYADALKLRESLPSIQALGFAPRLKASEFDAFLRRARAEG